MKISKMLITASIKIAGAMGIVVCATAILTAPAHAKAIGETHTRNGGTVTVFDNSCPGVPNHPDWFLAEAYAPNDAPTYGCWTLASRTQLRIVWPFETEQGTIEVVPMLYEIKGFHDPKNL